MKLSDIIIYIENYVILKERLQTVLYLRKRNMRLKNVLITVKDMEKSKAFYKELFGLDVILDNDGKAILTEGLVLQDENIWKEVVGR